MSSFWQNTVKAKVLRRNRKSITIPAFAARSGEIQGSVDLNPRDIGSGVTGTATGAGYSIVAAFSVEMWLKTSHLHSTKGFVFVNYRAIDGTSNVDIGLENGKVVVRLRKAGAYTTLTTSSYYPTNTWFKLTVTYDGTTCKVYFNETVDATTAALAASLDAATGNQATHVFGSASGAGSNFYVGRISEMRVWNIALTAQQIKANLYFRRGKNLGLISYYKTSNATLGAILATFKELIADASVTTGVGLWDTDDVPPLKYGTSFIAAKFNITVDDPLSLIYPTNIPDDANFMMCVSYVGDDDRMVRYKLWDMDGVVMWPQADRYRGQKLPVNFFLEVWNIDGGSDCTLADDLEILVSKNNVPANQTDETNADLLAVDPTIDYSIFENFPMAFPATFEDSGFGTVAAPETQPVGTYSTNLTVWGGIQ